MALTREKAQLMSASEIDRTLVRLAHEILEKTKDLDRLAFIGIRRDSGEIQARIEKKHTGMDSAKALKIAKRRILWMQIPFFVFWIGAVITGVFATLFAANVL